VQVRWGLVPRWARDPSIGTHMINARAETVATKGAFRHPFARHRCLVPVSGFYEWQAGRNGKQPVHIGMRDGRPFGLAGLYERWLSPEGEVLDTCTIVTTSACDSLRHVHDRMPAIIPDADYARWLHRANDDASDLLAPWSGEPLYVYPVSRRVNAVRNDDPTLVERMPEEAQDEACGTEQTAVGAAVPEHEREPDQLPLL
jgi:putative SOS response-associated peptidase YedK